VVTGDTGSFDFKGIVHDVLIIEADKFRIIEYEPPVVVYLSQYYYVGVVNLDTRPVARELAGTAYIYTNGAPVPLANVSVTIKDNAGTIAQGKTTANGTYKITIPDAKKTADNRYDVTVAPANAEIRILSEDRTQYGTPNRKVCADSPVDFYFVKTDIAQVTYTGYVKGLDGKVIKGANVSYLIDWAVTDAKGYFTYNFAKSWIAYSKTQLMNPNFNVYNATGYISKNFPMVLDEVELYKNNGTYDVGTFYLAPSIGGGKIINDELMTIRPNPVSAGDLTYGTLQFTASQAINSSTIVITADNHSSFQAAGVKLYKNDVEQPINASSLSVTDGTMSVKLPSIAAKDNYRLQFATRAPNAEYTHTSFDVNSKIVVGNTDYYIASEMIAINHLSLIVTPIIPTGSKDVRFYGKVISENARISLNVYPSNAQNNIVANKSIDYRKTDGLYYSFDNVDLSKCTAGNYTAVVQLTYNGQVISSDSQNFKIENDSFIVTKIEMKAMDSDTIDNPRLGEYAIVNTIDGRNGYMSIYPVTVAVTFSNASKIKSAEIAIVTDLGTFSKKATLNSNTYSTTYNNNEIKGNVSGSVYIDITNTANENFRLLVGKLNSILDPSGYVYDAKTKEFIEGAEAKLWWKNSDTGKWEEFPAYKYDQKNPYVTDGTGWYEFWVPEGEYRVDVTAEGYEPSDSDKAGYGTIKILPVRTDVDIPLNAK